mgnify:CR=1 FL=1
MKEFQYTIQDPMGFHARPAGALVRAAKAYESRITIACGEKSAQLTRLMAVMALGIKQGQTVTVTIDARMRTGRWKTCRRSSARTLEVGPCSR